MKMLSLLSALLITPAVVVAGDLAIDGTLVQADGLSTTTILQHGVN